MTEEKVNTFDPVRGEAVDVPDHPMNVPDHELPKELDNGDVLLSSDMRADPVEGVQGTFTVGMPEQECDECGMPGLHYSQNTLAGVGGRRCPHCGSFEEV